MKKTALKSDVLLLLVSSIWGFAFVAQRVGMEFIGPFLFNGIRFFLGALFLIPICFIKKNKTTSTFSALFSKKLLLNGLILGIVLFLGASLQQAGMVFEATTAGKAGFITGLYVLLVPLFGIFIGNKTGVETWIGGAFALIGLFFLSVQGSFSFYMGDFLVFFSSIFWALHVLIIDKASRNYSSIHLAVLQYFVCSIFSFLTALLFEDIFIGQIFNASAAIIYGGIFSVGIAYTLQIVAQKSAHPSYTAIILSFEGIFAVIGGVLILKEFPTNQQILGCFIMLLGMFISKLKIIIIKKIDNRS